MFKYSGPQQANVLDDQSTQHDSQSFGYEEVPKTFQELLFWQTLSGRDRNKHALKVQIEHAGVLPQEQSIIPANAASVGPGHTPPF